MINDSILSLIKQTPDSILRSIALRVKERRLERNWTQKNLAARAGMPLPTFRRFESTGEVSLRGLVMIAKALDMDGDFAQLFAERTYQSIEDLLNVEKKKQRKRGGGNG